MTGDFSSSSTSRSEDEKSGNEGEMEGGGPNRDKYKYRRSGMVESGSRRDGEMRKEVRRVPNETFLVEDVMTGSRT